MVVKMVMMWIGSDDNKWVWQWVRFFKASFDKDREVEGSRNRIIIEKVVTESNLSLETQRFM